MLLGIPRSAPLRLMAIVVVASWSTPAIATPIPDRSEVIYHDLSSSVAAALDKKNHTSNGLMHAIYDSHMLATAWKDDHEDSSQRRRHLTIHGIVMDIDEVFDLSWREGDRLLVEVESTMEAADRTLRPHLESYGFDTMACGKYACSGFLDLSTLLEVERLPSVLSVVPSMSSSFMASSTQLRGSDGRNDDLGYGRHLEEWSYSFGSTKSHGFQALQVDKLRLAFPHLTGTGMTIGVLSDSYNTKCGAESDVASGDLPSDVVVLEDSLVPMKDEGRAMMQLIHDVAPGAKLVFRTANGVGVQSIVNGIFELADYGCDVIVDDVVNFAQPFFQEGPIAQAASDVAEHLGIAYFASAGNYGRKSWESKYQGVRCPFDEYVSCHDFGDGIPFQRVSFTEPTFMIFQWDDPFPPIGASTDMDVFLLDPITDEMLVSPYGPSDNRGDAPIEFVPIPPGIYDIVVGLYDGPSPNYFKWIVRNTDALKSADPPTNCGYLTPQANTVHTAGVGAADEKQIFTELKMESFSSAGGTPLWFNRDGSRKAKPMVLEQPRFVGPDGSSTTFFGFLFDDPRGEAYPDTRRFYGTSASAPHVAAVASLMLQAAPDLPPSLIYSILEDTAIDMNQKGFDFDSGHGFVNAMEAVNRALSLTGGKKDSPKTKKTKAEVDLLPQISSECSFVDFVVDYHSGHDDDDNEVNKYDDSKKTKHPKTKTPKAE